MDLNSKEIFSRLMKLYNVDKMNEYSKMLGYKENWASACKMRNTIPFEACVRACIDHNVTMDYLLFGDSNENKNIDINDLKIAVAEGIFTLLQLNMMEPAKDVKITTMADVIVDEVANVLDIKTENKEKKAI